MRRPRRLRPGTRWFVTVRCARAQYRLRPDPTRRHALGFFLGRALEACSGVRLHAAVQMSNHIHMVVTDEASELDRFMCRLLGPLGKALNRLDGVRGQVFERRYSAIEIVDDDALLDRLVYTVTNPAAADLVARAEDWPGLCLWPGGQEEGTFERVRRRAPGGAVGAGGRDVVVEASSVEEARGEEARVEVTCPELGGRDVRAELHGAVAARLGDLEALRGGKGVLGARKALAQRVFDAPERPKRSPMPLCHASTVELCRSFRDGWRAFERAFRVASAAFRAGAFDIAFPAWSFRPSVPLLC